MDIDSSSLHIWVDRLSCSWESWLTSTADERSCFKMEVPTFNSEGVESIAIWGERRASETSRESEKMQDGEKSSASTSLISRQGSAFLRSSSKYWLERGNCGVSFLVVTLSKTDSNSRIWSSRETLVPIISILHRWGQKVTGYIHC